MSMRSPVQVWMCRPVRMSMRRPVQMWMCGPVQMWMCGRVLIMCVPMLSSSSSPWSAGTGVEHVFAPVLVDWHSSSLINESHPTNSHRWLPTEDPLLSPSYKHPTGPYPSACSFVSNSNDCSIPICSQKCSWRPPLPPHRRVWLQCLCWAVETEWQVVLVCWCLSWPTLKH